MSHIDLTHEKRLIWTMKDELMRLYSKVQFNIGN